MRIVTALDRPQPRHSASAQSSTVIMSGGGSTGPTSRAQAGAVDRNELRYWIEDALSRHDRDVRERDESIANVTANEIVDAVWGRLPLEVRRQVTRAQVQAGLTVLTALGGASRAGTETGGTGTGRTGTGDLALPPA
jgi:hypothetical protein